MITNNVRLCDKCHVAVARYHLPVSDLAFCGHCFNGLPDSARTSYEDWRGQDIPEQVSRDVPGDPQVSGATADPVLLPDEFIDSHYDFPRMVSELMADIDAL